MTVSEIAEIAQARLVAGNKDVCCIEKGFCSDLMSDVLTLDTDRMLLITGMTNLQTIRTAEMADVLCILIVRKKKATPEMLALAKENGMVILETDFSMYKAAGELYKAGLIPVY